MILNMGVRGFFLVLSVSAFASACGDDSGSTSADGGGGSAASETGPSATSGGGDAGGGAKAVGEALIALMNVEDEIFTVEVEGSAFSLVMNRAAGIVFAAPLFDCGAGIGTCVEVFREGFTEPTELAVEDGGTAVHVFAGEPGEEGDATSNDELPEPGIEESVVVVRNYLVGPELVLSAPGGTLSPLASGIATVGAGQEIAFIHEDDTISLTDIVIEEGGRYAIASDVSSTGGIELVVCPLEDGEDCLAWSFN